MAANLAFDLRERVESTSQQVRDQIFDKKVESVSQTRTNLSKTWLCRWLE